MADADRVRGLFDSLAADYDLRYPGPAEGIDAFADRLPRGGRVLDVGCGPGVSVAHLAARGFDAWGIDLSPRMIDRARQRHPGLRFEVGDMRRLPSDAVGLSGILAAFSLIFLPYREVAPTLRDFHPRLKDGGLLHVVVQEGREDLDGSPLIFSHPGLRRLLEEAGYAVEVDRVREPRPHEMPTRKRSVTARKVG